jgi:hypothetical protein
MPNFPVDDLLEMLRDPNRETQEISIAVGVPREDAGRAARIVMGIAKAKAEDVATLPTPLALAVLRAAELGGRIDLLASIAAHPSKEVAKEAKRLVYLLRTRGMAVPAMPRAAPPTPPPTVETPVPCYASALDGHGERAIWFARSIPGKGIEIAQAVVSDQKGLTELHLGMLGRKEYRAFARDLLERGRGMGVVEIDRELAKGLVVAARSLNDRAQTSPPAGADAWLARIGPAATPPDPASRFAPLPEEEERAAVADSGRLHQLPLVRGWLADEDSLRALALKLDEIAVSSLYLDERQRADASLRLVSESIASHFDEKRRALWSSRLFLLADHLDRGGDPASARLAAAAGRALRGGVPVEQIPFARLLVEKAFPPRSPPPEAGPERDATPLVIPPR